MSVTDGRRIILKNRRHVKQYIPEMAVTLPPATEVKAAIGTGHKEPSTATPMNPTGQVPTNQSMDVTQGQSSQSVSDTMSSETPATNPGLNGRRESTAAEAATSQSTLEHSLFKEGVVTRSRRQVQLSVRAKEADM